MERKGRAAERSPFQATEIKQKRAKSRAGKGKNKARYIAVGREKGRRTKDDRSLSLLQKVNRGFFPFFSVTFYLAFAPWTRVNRTVLCSIKVAL